MIYRVIDRENLEVTGSVKQLTPTKLIPRVVYARIQVQVASIRVTTDGTDPNPATPVGEVFSPLDFFEVWGDSMRSFKMVKEATSNANVEVTYMGTG